MNEYKGNVKSAIDKALIEKFGNSKFDVMYGLLSPFETLEGEEGPYFSPSTVALVKENSEIDMSFAVGAKGKILGDNHQVVVNVLSKTSQGTETVSTFLIPNEAVYEDDEGIPTFGVGGNLDAISFKESSYLQLQVYVKIQEQDVIEAVNAEIGQELIKESVGVSVVVAGLKVKVLGENEDE